jgi:prepilin-type N-terminal cleavage/methylation domain-containing protein
MTKIFATIKKILMNDSSGFTLIELLLVIALISISIGVTGDIMISLTRSYNKSSVINELEQASNFIGLKIEKELRNATNVIVTNSGTRMQFENGTNTVYYNFSGGNLYRHIDTTGTAFSWTTPTTEAMIATPTINGTSGGINLSCDTTCFAVTGANPQVVNLGLVFSQASAGGISFQGKIILRNTIVVRNTY